MHNWIVATLIVVVLFGAFLGLIALILAIPRVVIFPISIIVGGLIVWVIKGILDEEDRRNR